MEHLNEFETDYHAKILANRQRAEELAKQANLDVAAFESWSQYVTEKYGLGPMDGVDQQGNITRGAPPVPVEDHQE